MNDRIEELERRLSKQARLTVFLGSVVAVVTGAAIVSGALSILDRTMYGDALRLTDGDGTVRARWDDEGGTFTLHTEALSIHGDARILRNLTADRARIPVVFCEVLRVEHIGPTGQRSAFEIDAKSGRILYTDESGTMTEIFAANRTSGP